MKYYETTFIVNPQTDDASIDRQVQGVTDLITQNGGNVINENRMGTRRLAYPIQGLTQGFYTSVVFEAPKAVLPVLDRHFHLDESYMRYLTVLFEGNIEDFSPREETADDSYTESAPAAVPAEETVAEPEPVVETPAEAAPEPEPEPVVEAEAPVETPEEPAEEETAESEKKVDEAAPAEAETYREDEEL